MDSLFSILSNKDFDEPPEVAAVKKFVRNNLDSEVTVQLREKDLIIVCSSGSQANALRLRVPELKRRCQIDKRIVIRIG